MRSQVHSEAGKKGGRIPLSSTSCLVQTLRGLGDGPHIWPVKLTHTINHHSGVLCLVGCSAASLASSHKMPVPPAQQ